MKLLLTSDVHQWGIKWKDLVSVSKRFDYDAIVIAGDIVPKDGFISDQSWFIPHLRKYAQDLNIDSMLYLI